VLARTPCDICKGACCESFALSFTGLDEDKKRWILFHGHRAGNGRIEFECRCEHLGNRGECKIYDRRPEICKAFPVGSPACLHAINTRRPFVTATKVKLAIARMGKE
jgi:Fe-S-cluster containining protein